MMLLRNTLYNFLGLGLPLLVAIVTIPVLIESLGLDRFGILTLIWAQNEQEKVVRLIPAGLGCNGRARYRCRGGC